MIGYIGYGIDYKYLPNDEKGAVSLHQSKLCRHVKGYKLTAVIFFATVIFVVMRDGTRLNAKKDNQYKNGVQKLKIAFKKPA